MIFLLVKTENSSLYLRNNRKYKLQCRNFKPCLNVRLQLKINHRISEFKRAPFLKPFVKCNTNLQKEAEKEGNKTKKRLN